MKIGNNGNLGLGPFDEVTPCLMIVLKNCQTKLRINHLTAVKSVAILEKIVYNQLIEKIDCLKIADNELLSVIDVKDIEKELEQCESFMKNLISYKCKISQKSASLTPPIVPPTIVHTTNLPSSTIDTLNSEPRSSIKLPKLTVNKFYGDHKNAKAISGFALTESNYDIALELLKTRFGQKNLLIKAHLGSLLNITPIKNTSDTNSLRKLYDRAETEIRNLESLGINSESYCNLLTQILLKVLPSDLTLELSRKNKSDNWDDLKALPEFLGEEIQSRERAQSFHSAVRKQQNSNNSNKSSIVSLSAQGLITEMLMLNRKAIIPQQPNS
ncbi:DUF1758 domain-containing protein [Trichonephila clavipes]|nr:DUF1758 domain-containing protein [Trichonephila clavipes]